MRTIAVDYSTTVTMPKEDDLDCTRRGILRRRLREWCGKTFANKSTVAKEVIVLNDDENCLSCQGFVKEIDGKWIITNDSRDATHYGAYKLFITKGGEDVGHEDLNYYFMADTVGYVTSVDVHDGF